MCVRLPGTILPTVIFLLALGVCFGPTPMFARAAEVHLVTYNGPITPVAAEFLVQGIENPAEPGKVVCHGEIWEARADLPLAIDSRVRVVAVEGRVVRVVPASQSDEFPAKQRS